MPQREKARKRPITRTASLRRSTLSNTSTGDASSSIHAESEPPDSENEELPKRQKRKGKDALQNETEGEEDDGPSQPSDKRRKTFEKNPEYASQIAHVKSLMGSGDLSVYDPDQDMDERRTLRRGMRGLLRDVTESRSQYMSTSSQGLQNTLSSADDFFKRIKQTADATIDSRLMVELSDLTSKKTSKFTLGNSSVIDVDEFVGKCISFMRSSTDVEDVEGSASQTTQTRRRGTQQDDTASHASSPSDEEVVDNTLDWGRLGREACFPNNFRPPVPGFLLGPLSIQKRSRKITQRTARAQIQPQVEVRPDELEAKDLEESTDNSLTKICTDIFNLLIKEQSERWKRVDQEKARLEREKGSELTEHEGNMLRLRMGVGSDGTINFFHFVINPKSFGQTVENYFYVSFLVRDGLAQIKEDKYGMLQIVGVNKEAGEHAGSSNVQKVHFLAHLDFPTWRKLIEAYKIEESIIPNRDDSEFEVATTWY